MITIERKVHFGQGRGSRKELRDGKAPPATPTGRAPRVARLMALAIRMDQLIRDGVVADQAELARLGHVTRARVTQVMNLLCLAPDIQQAILFLPATVRGRDAVTERDLRPIAGVPDWRKQRRMWRQQCRAPGIDKVYAVGEHALPANCMVPSAVRKLSAPQAHSEGSVACDDLRNSFSRSAISFRRSARKSL